MRPHLAPVALDEEEAAPFAASPAAVSGNPLDLLPPRTRAVFDALRSMGSVSRVAVSLRLSRRTVYRHRAT
jgi:DNA-binding NarL/FixJ family response regulator